MTSFNDHIEAGLTRTDGIGQTGSGTVLNLTFELAQSLAADDTIASVSPALPLPRATAIRCCSNRETRFMCT
ncbi:MAG: hypothetical protein R3C26_25530 [Calditrichia bacterium]